METLTGSGNGAPGPGSLQRSHTVGLGELKRSPSYHQHQYRSRRGGGPSTGGGGGGGGGKPTLEIYRPPNVRLDGVNSNGDATTTASVSAGNKLNVHAKEFTMQPPNLKTSRSSGNILASVNNNNSNSYTVNNNSHYKLSKSALLQQSKSSGNIMHALQNQKQSTSTGNALQQSHRVHFRFDVDNANSDGLPSPAKTLHAETYGTGRTKSHRTSSSTSLVDQQNASEYPQAKPLRQSKTLAAIQGGFGSPSASSNLGVGGIKRSKSLGAADVLGLLGTPTRDLPDLSNFPVEVQTAIQRAVEDPNQVSARTLMQLVRHIMDKVLDSRSFAEPAAKLCITIIEKEKNETFLESLLNTCQLWYQNRDRYLKASSPPGGLPNMRYPAFMAFLNEMYCQLKRRQLQLKTQYDGVAPGLLLLTLLSKCCQECLKPPAINSLKDMECLFFVLSSIGKDLETELPARMNAVLSGVRDAFLTSAAVPAIRKTLLQLIELHAAQWQLPAPAIMYYYPTTSK